MTKHYVFSYGTLQHQNIQLELYERLLSGKKDSIVGFEMRTIELGNHIYPAICKSEKTTVIERE